MPRWGTCEFKEIEAMVKKLQRSDQAKYAEFCATCARALAARLLAKVIKRTPVIDGTLRRGWTAKTEAEAASGSGAGADAVMYAAALPVSKRGRVYEVEIINPVHYAHYVEVGHRTRNHKGFVQGQFMLRISEEELEGMVPGVLEKLIKAFLEECFNGQ